MTRAMLLATALVLASAATAADEPAPATPKKTSTKPSSKTSTKASKDKASTGKASPATKGGSVAGSPADQAQVAEVFRAKTNLLFAVEACDRPERCDKVFRSEAEARFMKACLECAPEERCEADRQTIRDGNGKRSYNPCSAK